MAKDFDFTVDDQEYENSEKKLTPDQILTRAGFDPADYYLVEVVGAEHLSFQGKGDQLVNLKKENKFVTVYVGPVKDFDFRVDGEEYESEDKKRTANSILTQAGFDPNHYYLVELEGKKHHSYQGEGDKLINLKKENDFITVYTGPTTVSYDGLAGQALFADQLTKMGYHVTLLSDGEITFGYEVEVGKYAGKNVTHGIVVPADFPLSPPSGPHVKPEIHPCVSGGTHPTGGVHQSSGHAKNLKGEWQYWSRPYPDWSNSPKNAAAYMAFIRSLWATQ